MFIDELNNLRYQVKFSMDEIIPVLEEKISKIKGEDYKIDFFVTNEKNASTLEVRYLAFPKQDSYIKGFFSYNNCIYKYIKKDERHESLKKYNLKDHEIPNIDFKNVLDIKENEKVYLIAKEDLSIKDSFKYLTMPHEEKTLLFNDFFCYEQELDELGDTIVDFAKKKTPKN